MGVFAVTLDEETVRLGRRALQRLTQDAGLKARRYNAALRKNAQKISMATTNSSGRCGCYCLS